MLRDCGPLKLLAVHASSGTRFGFLKRRRRSDDPDNPEKLHERDRRELGVGISDPIALADESISNNNLSKDELGRDGVPDNTGLGRVSRPTAPCRV